MQVQNDSNYTNNNNINNAGSYAVGYMGKKWKQPQSASPLQWASTSLQPHEMQSTTRQ